MARRGRIHHLSRRARRKARRREFSLVSQFVFHSTHCFSRDVEDLVTRGLEDDRLFAREFDDNDLFSRDFDEDELLARDFDDDELFTRNVVEDLEDLVARGFDDELYPR